MLSFPQDLLFQIEKLHQEFYKFFIYGKKILSACSDFAFERFLLVLVTVEQLK